MRELSSWWDELQPKLRRAAGEQAISTAQAAELERLMAALLEPGNAVRPREMSASSRPTPRHGLALRHPLKPCPERPQKVTTS